MSTNIPGFTGVQRGIPGATEFFASPATNYSGHPPAMTELFERPGAVASFGRYQCTVNATGKSIDTPLAHFFGFRDGRVCRYVNILNSAAILEAADA